MKKLIVSTFLLAGFILSGPLVAEAADKAEDIIAAAGVKGGLIVHLGCGDGRLTAGLKAGDQYLVGALDSDAANVAKARDYLASKGIYGGVSVMQLTGNRLPYADDLVNLIVADKGTKVSEKEILRVLCPLGVAYIKTGGKWSKTLKPWPEGMDQWTHYLHGPQNNAVANDAAIGAPRSLRWSGPPRWGRTHEELASMSAMVTAGGRVFYIIDDAPLVSLWYPAQWKLVACDAFNGTKLWDLPIAKWNDHLRHFRSGPLHLPRRLVAVGGDVFATLGLDAPVTRLDAATGKVQHTYKGTERTEEIVCHNSVLYLMVGTSEVTRSGAGLSQRGEPKPTKTRFLIALDVASGRELWRKNAKGPDFILPLSLTALGDKVFYQDIRGITCADARTGTRKWLAKRQTPAKRYGWSTSTFVVTEEVVLCADRKVSAKQGATPGPAATDLDWGVTCFGVPSIGRRGSNELIAYSMTDGGKLWSAPCSEGYNSPVDVFVVDSTVWLGSGFSKGYDLKTGKVVKSFSTKPQPVGMVHHRCYRNKASSKFIFTGRDGIELIDVKKGPVGNNSWVRGTCQYGIMPANGMLYAPPDACGCHPKTRLQGFNALSSMLPASAGKAVSEAGRLVKGPVYGKVTARETASGSSWSMYRCDPRRSGATAAVVADSVKLKWTTDIGGKLTQPVSANGKVFVASIDSHTLYALAAADGRKVWSYTASSRIDSSPTLYKGLAIFGSADGWVYCLDQGDGQVVWRFHAAPQERFIAIHGRLESSWPVHGSVLVQNDELIFTAGRSTYLDGGIYFYRLNPVTGKMLATALISHLDPVTGKQTGKETRGTFDSEGTTTDILSSDGESIFIKHMCFDLAGKETKTSTPHLFSPTGMLGEEWFVRAFWLYGTNTGAGYFRWANMKSNALTKAPAGRIMSFDDKRIYGYGRVKHSGSWTGHRGDSYHLFSSVKVYSKPQAAAPAAAKRRAKKAKPAAGKAFIWSQKHPLIVRAMVLTGDKLIVAGIPDLARKTKSGLAFANPDDGLAALRGERGAYLTMISKADGSKTAEIKLESPPVFDGMSAITGNVFVSLKNGKVMCFADKGD